MVRFERSQQFKSESTSLKMDLCLLHSQSSSLCLRNHCFDASQNGALIDLIVRCRLCRQVSVRLDLHPVIHLRITTVGPQRCPARRE